MLKLVSILFVLYLSCLAQGKADFVKEEFHFLEIFSSMIRGTHLPVSPEESRNGGTSCAGCSIVLILIESLASVHKTSIEYEVEQFCKRLPTILQEPCNVFVTEFGPTVITMLENKETADAVCLAINFCKANEPGGPPVCRLMNPPNDLKKEMMAIEEARSKLRAQGLLNKRKKIRGVSSKRQTPWEWLLEKLEYTFNNHVPFSDYDNDTFSTLEEFRGYSWRGRDCNDFDANIRPGRNSKGLDGTVDWNCNGIYGMNEASGKSWEEELCGNTTQYGVINIGDSAGAHFHIPPDYFNATMIQDDTFQNLVEILANEFDWPMMSSQTGYMNSSWIGSPPSSPLGENSIYQHYLNRNRCMFRDYQNLCVNGARSTTILPIAKTLRRNQKQDLPLIVGLELIGNDVCNGHLNTSAHWTSPADFKAGIVATLDYLDSVLPLGSHVSTYSLAQGSLLYEIMHARVHPLGAVFNEITYTRIYDYLNCLDVSPCRGWMNSNATIRNETTAYAQMLSKIYDEIIAQYTTGPNPRWHNFDLYYWNLDFSQILNSWVAKGGDAGQLVEPVDGFHPSQNGVTLLADFHISQLQKVAPQLIPPINPNNEKIQQLFGQQGGY